MNIPREYDILEIADFALPPSTGFTHYPTEIGIQSELGLRTGLLPVRRHWRRSRNSWSADALSILANSGVGPVLGRDELRARLAIVRDPEAFTNPRAIAQPVVVDEALVPVTARMVDGGTLRIDLERLNESLERQLGRPPMWAGVNERIQDILSSQSANLRLCAEPWRPVVQTHTASARRRPQGEIPQIGRHSERKTLGWPRDGRTLRRVYPTTAAFQVRIRGDIAEARSVLGGNPGRWIVEDETIVGSSDFLKNVDFWVDWPESLSTFDFLAAIQAMGAGCVVILPATLEGVLGNAALYAEPREVRGLIEDLYADEERFSDRSSRAQAYAENFTTDAYRTRLARIGVTHRHPRETDGDENGLSFRARTAVHVARRRRVGLLTSNGAGMGHLTRVLGIARALKGQADPVILSMSQAVGYAREFALPFEYIPYSAALGADQAAWNDYFRTRLTRSIDVLELDAIAFDGTWPYRGLLEAIRDTGITSVWIRRAMWKPHISPNQLRRSSHFDLVIEPGEYASALDTGATSRVRDSVRVDPITVLGQHELLPREEARARLGIPADSNVCLLALGAGNINDTNATRELVLSALATQDDDWLAVITKSPIAEALQPVEVHTVEAFPLARYARAFDFAVSASGYNSFHEWFGAKLPTVWVPNHATKTDNQHARAAYAAQVGAGLILDDDSPEAVTGVIHTMCDPEQRQQMINCHDPLVLPNGAAEAARLIGGVLGLEWKETC